MCVLFSLGIVTIETRTNRENNIQKSLKKSADDAVTSILENQSYSIENNEQFVATFTEMLCDSLVENSDTSKDVVAPRTNVKDNINYDTATMDSNDHTTKDNNLKLTIEVVEADYAKGLLSLNIIEEYTNPIGRIGTCEYATTVVFDEAKIYDTYLLKYFDANGILIHSFVVRAGDPWPTLDSLTTMQYHITKWGTEIGGGGEEFKIPKKVPLDSATNNVTSLKQYDAATNSINLYGNYEP